MADLLEQLKSLEKERIDKYYAKEPPTSDKEKRTLRNEIVHARICAYNYNFNLFEADFYREGILLNVGSGWAIAALDGAATVIGGNVKALTATSMGLGTARSSFAENVYVKKAMQATLSQMEAHRKEILARILEGLTSDIDTYPLEQALANLEEYYRAGTIPGAIVEIIEMAGAVGTEADKKIEKILLKGKFGPDENSKRLAQFLEYDGTTDQNTDGKTRLITWMKGYGLSPPADIAPLIYWAEHSSARSKAVADLDLLTNISPDADTERLEKYLWLGDKFDKGKLDEFKVWLKQQPSLTGVCVYDFLYKKEYKSERTKAPTPP